MPGQAIEVAATSEALLLRPRAPVYGTDGPSAFRYRIASLDTQWHTVAGTRPEIFLAAVPEGRHVIEVAVDREGSPITTLYVAARLAWWRRPLTLAVGFASFAGALGFGFYRRARRRARDLRLQGDLRRATLAAIAAQMNPHFMFNALNSIQEFVLDEDPVNANAYLSRFARLMRLTLDHSRAELVPLRDEIEAMRLYAELEGLRLDGTVEIRFEVDPGLTPEALLPPLLVQPYIENAFKHGLGHTDGGRLLIRYARALDATLVVEVCDNGIGRVASARHTRRRPTYGFGMGATAQRVRLLCEASPGSVEIKVEDLYREDDPGQAEGTLVRLRIRLNTAPATSARLQPMST